MRRNHRQKEGSTLFFHFRMETQGQDLIERVKALIAPELSVYGLEVYDLEYKQGVMGMTLSVYLDRPGGKVNLKDCQSASHLIGEVLDASEVIPAKYILEVSSVGLDRELKTKKDFDRFNGQEARIITRVLIGKDNTFTGIITACDKAAVTLSTGKGEVLIPLNDIARAKLEIKF